MKKYVIMASVILMLAGCSASSSLAQPEVEQKSEIVVIKPISFMQQLQLKKNTVQMHKVIKYLKTRVGKTSYVFSGSSPRGWDCSGMVRWTYERFGLEIPHSANKQGHIGKRVSKPKIGDIVVFAYRGSTNFYHAAIYIGNNKVINANAGPKTTVIQPLSDYKGSQIRYVRLIETL